MASKNAAEDLATQLATDLGGSYTLGTNVFWGMVRDGAEVGIPDLCIFVVQTGGPGLESWCGEAGNSGHRPSCQVVIRGNPRAHTAGAAVAELVKDAVHQMSLSGYVDVVVTTDISFIGMDDRERPRWTVNAMLTYEG